MENNLYIKCWKNTIEWLVTTNEILYENNNQKYSLSKKSNDIRELASKQLKILDDTRSNKEETLYKQSNKQQKEFIDYLEKVILYGNIEGKENYNL